MRRNRQQTLRFTRLRLINWKNFQDAEVRLAARAFFVGANAAGKSNLLECLRFLRDLASPGGGLAASVANRRGIGAVRCLHAKRLNAIELRADIGTQDHPDLWSYHLKFNQTSKQTAPRVEIERVLHDGKEMLSRPLAADKSDPELLTQTHLEQLTQNKAFREIAEFLRSLRYLHVVPQIVRDSRRALDDRGDPYGGDLLARIASTTKGSRDSILNTIGQGLSIAVPQFEGLEFFSDSAGKPHLLAGFKHWRHGKARQTEAAFSDGTLRLIGFLWSIAEGGGPLLLEEPELSLNDAVARALPGMIATMQAHSGRQVLMTTHSTALLSDDGIGLDEAHLLLPTDHGTIIRTAADDNEVAAMVKDGVPLGDALLPKAAAADIARLAFLELA